MIKNYFKFALRNLAKNKASSFINIFGLSLGITTVILIGLFVQHEFSYDKWMSGEDQIYRVYRLWGAGTDKAVNTVWCPAPLAEKLRTDFPEVVSSSGLAPNGEILLDYQNNKIYVENSASVDSTFFDFISLPFIQGNPKTALKNPHSLVISKKLATQIFGEENPIGKTVKIENDEIYSVTGVIDLKNKNSHLGYDIFLRFTYSNNNWTGNNRATYVKLKPKVSVNPLEEKINTTITALMDKEFRSSNYVPTKEDFPVWKLQAFGDIYLNSDSYNWFNLHGGSKRNIYIFLIIAALILLVAIINYINLSTAQSTKRAKEIGVRKTAGASRFQLMGQFLSETIFQALIAAAIALLIAEALLPFFNKVIDRNLSFFGSDTFLFAFSSILLFALIVGLLAGVYPALIMSSFRPVEAMKANFKKGSNKNFFRQILVSGQFTVSIALLIVMAFIYRQVNFMHEYELGFKTDQIITIPLNTREAHLKIENLKTDIENISGVQSVMTCSALPGNPLPDWYLLIEGRDKKVLPYVLFTDEDYIKTLDIKMKSGRFISKEISADTLNSYVVNESFLKDYNIEKPYETRIKFTDDDTYGQIVGVVKDFHYRGLNSTIGPLIISGGHNLRFAGIKVSAQNLPETIKSIEQLWPKIEPGHPMRYTFLDEDFAAQYAEQEQFGKALSYATILTFFIAILGLFGLTTFSIERRTKEIGIRKVLGASIYSIVELISKEFLKLVAFAFVIAVPLGWYISNIWLEDFAYRVDMDWWIFAIAGIAAFLITIFTVSVQSIQAALNNPVDSLRTE